MEDNIKTEVVIILNITMAITKETKVITKTLTPTK